MNINLKWIYQDEYRLMCGHALCALLTAKDDDGVAGGKGLVVWHSTDEGREFEYLDGFERVRDYLERDVKNFFSLCFGESANITIDRKVFEENGD
jgi:hypothetical protein